MEGISQVHKEKAFVGKFLENFSYDITQRPAHVVGRRRRGASHQWIPMRYNSDKDQRLTIRLEDDLREMLTVEARQQMRSLCSEIKFRLRQSLERQDEATA